MFIPAGAPGSKLKVSALAGTSGSLAVAVRLNVAPSFTVWFGITASAVGSFTSFTVTEKLFASLRLGEPLSVTRAVMVYVPGPWDSLDVQVNRPVMGWMPAPGGAPESRL